MVVDSAMTDLLCMRLCSELSQAEGNPRHCKAGVGLSIWSREVITRARTTSLVWLTVRERPGRVGLSRICPLVSTLLACVDVLDAVALVREDRTVGAREILPAVILACTRVAGQVDTQQTHIVDRQ